MKRPVDIIYAILLLPLIAPVVFILWALVKRDGGAGFYGHERIGKDGKTFKCWKLRSMCVDSKERLAAHLAADPEAAAEWARDFKLENDPRVTKLGRIIRKTSLDELPQLFNVFMGEMSFVGPRPVVQEELDRYGMNRKVYLSMRPGITGIWQVMGRDNASYAQRVQMDVRYKRRIGFLFDLNLMVHTALVVIKPTGR